MVDVSTTPPSERYPGRPPEGRVIVIAPTRASCETIEIGVSLTGIDTVLGREHGEHIRELARSGRGFGIVAGTGTGKTLAVRPMAEEIVGLPLKVGVVNREREATPETPTQNVVIVTTGIARRWLQDSLIDEADTLVVDEIHQTSAELELCLALGKRAGCRFIWLSATVDPTFYAEYLDSAAVIESSAFDPAKAADVRVSNTTDPSEFLSDRFVRHVMKQKRGVAVFVPTRRETEEIATVVGEQWKQLNTVYYHGGEPVSKLTPFLAGEPDKPYLLAMTAAGQSALNIQGLDTVVIEDAQFTTLVERGKSVLTRLPLGANEILQMAGRVHGRVAGGEVWILTNRELRFEDLRPTEPNFQLAGDPERVAMTCADMGVRADELDLPVPLDRIAYRRAVALLEQRGLIRNTRLTDYGRKVEVLPVDRSWGELLAQADEHLVPMVAVAASIDSLHRMIKPENRIRPLIVPGSDHLTVYNIYADALRECGSLGTVYGLPRHVFPEEELAAWADSVGVLVRAIEDTALAVASIYRALELPLPRQLPKLNDRLVQDWRRLIARVMPFQLVMDGETSWGEEVQTSRTSVCGNWGAIAGDLRYFSDKHGRARGSIEGTEIPHTLIREFAQNDVGTIRYDMDRRRPLTLRRSRVYYGFELDAEEEPVDVFPEGLEDEARRALAAAVAASEAYHPDARENRRAFRELRETFRRSGGAARQITEAVLTDHLVERLAGVNSYTEFLETDLRVNADDLIPPEERARWASLPDTITLVGDEYPLDYAFEGDTPVVRARIPAKLLPQISERDLPDLDRPLHWTVVRGKKDAVRAATLSEARALMDAPKRERRKNRPPEEETTQPRRRRGPKAKSGSSRGGGPRTGGRGKGGRGRKGRRR